MGGEHDIDNEAEMDEQAFLHSATHRCAQMSLHVAAGLLCRGDEIAGAKKPGRHNETDVHMK